jgi:hypothetical protein
MTNVLKLQKGFVMREERHVFHVLRTIPALRKKLTSSVLRVLVDRAFQGVCFSVSVFLFVCVSVC